MNKSWGDGGLYYVIANGRSPFQLSSVGLSYCNSVGYIAVFAYYCPFVDDHCTAVSDISEYKLGDVVEITESLEEIIGFNVTR